jgi:hypothetical protein
MPSPVATATGPRPPMPTAGPPACQAEVRGVTAAGADNAHSLRAPAEAPPGRAVGVAPQLCSPEGGRLGIVLVAARLARLHGPLTIWTR